MATTTIQGGTVGSQIGRSLPRIEGRDKVSGRAEYTHNLTLPGMLHAKIFRSTIAHGRIKSIDVSAARKVPGVHRVVTIDDIKTVIPHPYYGPAFHDQPILAHEKVRFVGEPVAVVLASDPHVAEQAVQEITAEYEELPAVYDEVEALDSKVYVDASFFQELQSKFGANGGQLAKEYVVAHEYGHHIQDLLGILNRAQQDPQGPNSGSVRTELMADCLAGTWVKHATETTDANGTPLLQPITEQDIQSALSAAAAVGDDRIQEKMQGRVTPETWTHGSAKARMDWFTQGYRTGDINQCNTFGVGSVS